MTAVVGGEVETRAPTSRELFVNFELVYIGVKHSSLNLHVCQWAVV